MTAVFNGRSAIEDHDGGIHRQGTWTDGRMPGRIFALRRAGSNSA